MHDALFARVILPLAEMVVAEPLSGAIGGGGDDAAALASGDNLDAKMVDGHALLRVKIVHCKILPGRHARNKYLLSKNSYHLPQKRREATYKRAHFALFLPFFLPLPPQFLLSTFPSGIPGTCSRHPIPACPGRGLPLCPEPWRRARLVRARRRRFRGADSDGDGRQKNMGGKYF